MPSYLEDAGYDAAEVAERVDTLVTGARYQLYAALALLAIGLAAPESGFRWPARLLTFGAIVFCVPLYALAVVEGRRWLGAIVPIGGLATIAGWVGIAIAGWKTREVDGDDERDGLAAEVVRLEEVLTHQQQTVQALNEAITAARDAADRTERRSLSIEGTVKRLAEYQQGAEDLPDERPPHY